MAFASNESGLPAIVSIEDPLPPEPENVRVLRLNVPATSLFVVTVALLAMLPVKTSDVVLLLTGVDDQFVPADHCVVPDAGTVYVYVTGAAIDAVAPNATAAATAARASLEVESI